MIGLALGGGGARGAYQIGAWQALTELKVDITAVAGASIGALNGALVVQGDLDRAIQAWTDFDPRRLRRFNPKTIYRLLGDAALILLPWPLGKISAGVRTARLLFLLRTGARAAGTTKAIVDLVKSGFLDDQRLRELITRHVSWEAIVGSGKKLYVATTTGWPVVLGPRRRRQAIYHDAVQTRSPAELVDLITASMSLPFIYSAVALDDVLHLDGGLKDRIPISPLDHSGVRKIVAVHLKPGRTTDYPACSQAEIIDVSPSQDLGGFFKGTLNFGRDMKELIRLGYQDTLAACQARF
ncbi:MAG: patatin-like phospholipase family protein [Deltaproteobacteria bacterium]|nr:patatin-like phospholipase family protein [Deltaproteobacteria bacterium]